MIMNDTNYRQDVTFFILWHPKHEFNTFIREPKKKKVQNLNCSSFTLLQNYKQTINQ